MIQLIAPASAILSVRIASQLARNQAEIGLLQNEFRIDRARNIRGSRTGAVVMDVFGRQKDQIETEWNNAQQTEAINR